MSQYNFAEGTYEQRWYQRLTHGSAYSAIGYGPARRYIPPLAKPQTVAAALYRRYLVFWSGGPLYTIWNILSLMIHSTRSGDGIGMFWYDN